MKKQNDGERVEGLSIAYIGGGSRGWAHTLMIGLALEERLSGAVRLFDIDFESARVNAAIGNRLHDRPDAKGKWRYEAVKTIGEALTGADFVVLSILPGTFTEMHSDVHTPEKYGVYQSVGDTVGPGGAVRALRTIPIYAGFAESIRKYCPDAWVINYTNPMTLCTRTLYETFPQVKAFGCCHEVFGTQEDVAEMLRRFRGIEGVDRGEIHTNVMGVNHFTWIDRINYKGEDLMPFYREVAEKHAAEGFCRESETNWMNSYFTSMNRVKFDLLRRYGLVAAAGDRHLAEFMPPWYLKDPETAAKWKFSLTPVDWRIAERKKQDERQTRLVEGREDLELRQTGEEGVLQIMALLGLGDLVTNVNIPNIGQIEGLPPGAVVETNALFSRDSVRPVYAGRLPGDVQSLVMRHVLNQENLLRASFAGDRRLALNAFAGDPLLSGLDIAQIEALFGEMTRNTKAYLPEWCVAS
jgi:alpha-galactosidase/6-phospho-beta-glucosidase family protein